MNQSTNFGIWVATWPYLPQDNLNVGATEHVGIIVARISQQNITGNDTGKMVNKIQGYTEVKYRCVLTDTLPSTINCAPQHPRYMQNYVSFKIEQMSGDSDSVDMGGAWATLNFKSATGNSDALSENSCKKEHLKDIISK